jgi:ribosome-associated heat shock protein Hsp15
MNAVRMDKWLWAARFYKTRALAVRACEMGRVAVGEQNAKPARLVRTGDLIAIRNDAGDFVVQVLLLSEIRGPSAVAQTLYRETEESIALRLKVAAERKLMIHPEGEREGRPTKRDRREIGRLRGRG